MNSAHDYHSIDNIQIAEPIKAAKGLSISQAGLSLAKCVVGTGYQT